MQNMDFLAHGGEVGELMRKLDWTGSPLGEPSSWPRSLQTVVQLMLHSPTQMFLIWGDDLCFLYNDAYLEVLGQKHPAALGRPMQESWAEVWDTVHPLLQRSMNGEAFRFENHPFTIYRHGQPEQAWFNFSYTPLRDDANQYAGVLCILSETTINVIADAMLEEETQRLYQLFEDAPGFVAILHGPDHVYDLTNKTYVQLIGHRECIGRTVREVLPELKGQGFFELLDEVYSSGKPFTGNKVPVQLQLVPGSALEERCLNFIYQPIFGKNGSVRGIFVQGTDVTEQVEAEARLKEAVSSAELQRDRLNTLLNTVPVGIIMVDSKGSLLAMNAANFDIWGEKLPGPESVQEYEKWKGWWATGTDRYGQQVQPHEWPLARALKGETDIHDVIEIEPFDSPGARRTLIISSAPIYDAQNQLIGGMVAQMDITAQVQAEQALRESEKKFRNMSNAIPQIVWITDAEGRVEFFNQQWYRYTGSSAALEHAGQVSADYVHPDDHLQTMAAWEAAKQQGTTYIVEHRIRSASGEYRWFLVKGEPYRDPETNEIVRWYGTSTDIHSQKNTENELERINAESERMRRLYETFLDNSPDLAYVFDLNYRLTYANKMVLAMWGKSWEEAIGKNRVELGYEPWQAKQHDQEMEQAKFTKKPFKGETPFTGTFGRRIYEYYYVPIIGPDGEVEAVTGTTRDVTERKKIEDALQEANRRKDEFLAVLAHELRNPLAPIRTGLDLMRLVLDNPASLAKVREMMERQVNHLVHLVDDLLDIARIDSGKIELKKKREALKSIIVGAVETNMPAMQARQHELSVKVPEEPIWLEADANRLMQVVGNLLSNAARYTPEGGRISLSSYREKDKVLIEVADNGIGIPEEALSTIFEMFSQVRHGTGNTQGGLGIGLNLVKRLTEMHGGTVTASSGGEGMGSVFTLSLPVIPDLAEALPADGKDHTGHSASRRALKILIADDNQDAAEMLKNILEIGGHSIRIAHDGHSAMEVARQFHPDLALLDIGMPGLNGYEVADKIRREPGLKDTVLVAITGWGAEDDRAKSRQAGFNRHLTKPVNFVSLNQLISEVAPSLT